MTAFFVWRGPRPLLLLLALGLALSPVTALAADPVPVNSAPEPVTVYLDQARILKLPERTTTLVVGNPLIADAVVQPGGVVVVTAKSYGVTNLVALDRAGTMLMEQSIQVVGPSGPVIVVYRGIDRESYSCAPNCERRITLGDAPAFLAANLGAYGAYTAQSAGPSQR